MSVPDERPEPKPWSVYILRCSDGSFYTGITTDLERRLRQHNTAKGCAYTARRRPVGLAYSAEQPSKSAARTRELKLKPLSRRNKERLIESGRKRASLP